MGRCYFGQAANEEDENPRAKGLFYADIRRWNPCGWWIYMYVSVSV